MTRSTNKQPIVIDIDANSPKETGEDSNITPDSPGQGNNQENDTVAQDGREELSTIEPKQAPEPVIISPQPRLIIDESADDQNNADTEENNSADARRLTSDEAKEGESNLENIAVSAPMSLSQEGNFNSGTHSAEEHGIAQVLVDAALSTPALELGHVEIKQERLSPVQDVLARNVAANVIAGMASCGLMSGQSDPLLCDESKSSIVVKTEKDGSLDGQAIHNTIQHYLAGSESQLVIPDIKEEDDKKNIPLIKAEPFALSGAGSAVGSVTISPSGSIVTAAQAGAGGNLWSTGPMSVSCLWCKSSFRSLVELLNHLFVYGYQASTQAFKCWYCQKDYADERSWHTHLQQAHHKLSLLTCLMCRQYFHMETDLRLHNVIHHDDPGAKKRKLRRKAEPHKNKVIFECPVCKLSMIMCLPLVAYEHLITHQGREINNDNLGTFRLPSEDPLKGIGNDSALNIDSKEGITEITTQEVEQPTFIVTTEKRWRRPATKVVMSERLVTDAEAAQLNSHREITPAEMPQISRATQPHGDQTARQGSKKRPSSPQTAQPTKVHRSDIPSSAGKVSIIDPAKQSRMKVQLTKLSPQKLEKYKVPGTSGSYKIPESDEFLDMKPIKTEPDEVQDLPIIKMRNPIKLYHYPQTVTATGQAKQAEQWKGPVSIVRGKDGKRTTAILVPRKDVPTSFEKQRDNIIVKQIKEEKQFEKRCCKVFADPLKMVPKETLEWKDNRTAFACLWCKLHFPKPGDFIQHLKQHCKHGGGGVFVCQGCTAIFSSELQLYKHALYVHTNSGRNNYQCDKCDTTFCIPSGEFL